MYVPGKNKKVKKTKQMQMCVTYLTGADGFEPAKRTDGLSAIQSTD